MAGSSSIASATASAVVWPSRTRPAGAAVCSRAAVLTVSPLSAALVGAARRVSHLTGRHADPDSERPGVESEGSGQLVDRARDREPGPHRTLRVVVACAGHPERRPSRHRR